MTISTPMTSTTSMTSTQLNPVTPGPNGSTTPASSKTADLTSTAVSADLPIAGSPELDINILVTLLVEEQEIQAASEARAKDIKAKLDALRLAGHLTDKLTLNGYTLSRQSRTTYKYPPAVTKQVKALQELAQLNGDAIPATTNFWTLRKDKSCPTA